MWIPIEDDRYEVNEIGEVRNVTTGRIMKQRDVNGYKLCYITRDGKTTGYMVHRLVAIAFIPRMDGCLMIDHIDRDKKHNAVSNLRWCNRSTNNRNRSYFHSKADGMHHISQIGKKYKVSFMRHGKKIDHIADTEADAVMWRDDYIDSNPR
jgi:hypothetical protein